MKIIIVWNSLEQNAYSNPLKWAIVTNTILELVWEIKTKTREILAILVFSHLKKMVLRLKCGVGLKSPPPARDRVNFH